MLVNKCEMVVANAFLASSSYITLRAPNPLSTESWEFAADFCDRRQPGI